LLDELLLVRYKPRLSGRLRKETIDPSAWVRAVIEVAFFTASVAIGASDNGNAEPCSAVTAITIGRQARTQADILFCRQVGAEGRVHRGHADWVVAANE